MSQPPPESGNVVDPDVLAARRARRAEVSEDASLELRLFEADRRLGEVAAERDALRAQIEGFERDLRGTRQREWSEQQQRLEAQGEAAAARDLAGAQLAELRERLAEAEAELATVAAERERARTALQDERLRATAERERREALEREGVLLRAELVRREELTEAAADAVAQARRELAAGRASVADAASLEHRLAVERREFADRVVAVERAVAAVRERLGSAARVLRERLEAERGARLAAEAALGAERTARIAADAAVEGAAARASIAEGRAAELAGERDAAIRAVAQERARVGELERALAARVEVEAQLRRALDAVNGELSAVRAGDGERAAKLAARVESVVALATGLRDGVRRELGAEQDALTASLAAMQERVAELQAGVEEATSLREELEAERAARWVAEAELDAERRRGDEDRAARAFAEQRLADVEAELEELRAQPRPSVAAAPDPTALASLRAALEHLQAPAAGETKGDAPATPSLGLDLAAAAERLRATVAATEESASEAEVEPAAEPEAHETPAFDAFAPTSAAPEPPVATAPETARVEVAPAVSRDDAWSVSDQESSLDAPVVSEAPEPTDAPDVEVVPTARQPLAAREPITNPGPWLRDALKGLAVDEPDIAELLVVSLLSAQAGLVKDELTYELAVQGGTTHRVVVDPDRVRVELPGSGPAAVRVAGPLAALVPLVAGGAGIAGRRLPGARIDGRRQLRPLLRARRAPIGLSELAAADIAPSPGLLLTVLARAVDPSWIARPITVDIASEGSDRWRVVASGNGPLAIVPAAEDAGPSTRPAPSAVLHTSAHRLAAVLAGTAAPGDAYVEGDVRDVRTLLSWLDRAQRHQP
ncbi:hypothetical protein [Baekduia sp.]|jgi:hypothetical protein|uniref:hypothetical protein n=1 Tax=Baekduia sp. TaxID=2600305 RepID=UPI002E0AE2B4|nr:hypothetical protein [Baekduia sp.]